MLDAALKIAQAFSRVAIGIQALGNGYINDTYLVTTDGKPFVLQKINRRVFPHPEQIMANLMALNQHILQDKDKHIGLKIPQLLPAESGQHYFCDDEGEFWRALSYIENTESLETITKPEQAGQAGNALGQFHRLTQALDTKKLYDTLPGFHIAPQYFSQYLSVRSQSKVTGDQFCEDFIDRYQDIVNELEAAKGQGLLVERVIHGDPKLNNFLFDKASRRIVSLIDLDTVKPGLIHYDLGDCVRSCCHNIETGEFQLEIFHDLLTGYLEQMGALLTGNDIKFLYPAIRLIPFELGIRFYTDYLAGNRYFKVTEPDQNLQRAIGQFRFCDSVMSKELGIDSLIKQQANAYGL